MRLITSLYFGSAGENELTNITTTTGQVSAKTIFETFIGQKETDYLEAFFGYALAKIITDAIDALVTSATPLPSRIGAIANGAEFTDFQGHLQKWKGLKRPTELISPVADYVYYFWRQKQFTTTGQGETIPEVENSANAGPQNKIVTVWNNGVIQNRILADFMRVNIADYPEYHEYAYTLGAYGQRNLLSKINTFNL